MAEQRQTDASDASGAAGTAGDGSIGGSNGTFSGTNTAPQNPQIAATTTADGRSEPGFIMPAMQEPALKKWETIIPAEYKNDPWVQNISKTADPVSELFKKVRHQESVIGKNAAFIPPGDNATPEQIQQYRKAIGIPESPEAYNYAGVKLEGDDKALADALNASRPPEFMQRVSALAWKHGMPVKQFQQFAEDYDKLLIEEHKQALTAGNANAAKLDTEYREMVQAIYKNETDSKLAQAKQLAQSTIHPSLLPALGQLDNKALTIVTSFIANFADKYIREDNPVRSSATGSPVSGKTLRDERMEIMATQGFGDLSSPNYDSLKRRYDEINTILLNEAKQS